MMPASNEFRLERYSRVILAGAVIGVSAGLIGYGTTLPGTYGVSLIGIATSLLASLMFAYLYSWLVEEHYIASISAVVVDKAESTLRETLTARFKDVIPEEVFPATVAPDRRFNKSLEAELLNSRHYRFRGVTGRYVASRLRRAVTQRHTSASVLLLNPTNVPALRLYARDRFGADVVREEGLNALVSRVQREIVGTVVALFDVAPIAPVDIGFHNGQIFYRTELFDNALFLSFLTSKPAGAYPTTYKYSGGSSFYAAFIQDFEQTCELAEHPARWSAASEEQELIAFLKGIGWNDDLDALRKETAQRDADHGSYISEVGVDRILRKG